MRLWQNLFLLIALASHPLAAEPPKFAVPKTWEKVIAGGTPEAALTVYGGYTVWIDRVLVPETARNRAQSFTETLYRLKAGDKAAEKLETRVTTHGLCALLGPAGEVAAGWFADCQTLHLPGLKPIPMPTDARYAAHQFTADGLICAGQRYDKKGGYYEVTILLCPIDRAKNALGEVRVLRPWMPVEGDGFSPDFAHGRVFARGNFVALTGTVPDPTRTKRPGFTKPATEVWDTKNEKAVWLAEVAVEAADDTYAYWFPTSDTVARRPLDGTGRAEQLALPKDAIRLDTRPPKLFALMKQDKEWVLTRFDLTTGDRTEYDLRVPDDKPMYSFQGGRGPSRSFVVRVDPADAHQRLPLAVDAAGGEVRVACDGTVYRIPDGKKLPAAAKPKWEPLPDAK